MRHFGCPISGEEVEIQFSLYDMQHLRFVRYSWNLYHPDRHDCHLTKQIDLDSRTAFSIATVIKMIFPSFWLFLLFSEKFLVKVLKEGFSSYVDKLNDNATLFTVRLVYTFGLCDCQPPDSSTPV
jgi:hypothetical protein